MSNPLEISVTNIEGKQTKLSALKAKAYLVVNTASECGYTPQYKGLQALYDHFKDKGLAVVGFPSNDFGGQEPGTEAEIKSFCDLKFKVSFPMYAKVKIKGEEAHPLYKFLQFESPQVESRQAVKWNFNKFLIGEKGEVLAYFPSNVEPESDDLVKAITKALKK